MVEETLRSVGAKVHVEDLYAARFSPILGRAELEAYFSREVPIDVVGFVQRLQSASELVFVLPLWNYDMPAMLKGYLDRVFRPNVSFHLDNGEIQALLFNIRRIAAIVTHGQTKAVCEAAGDCTHTFFSRSLPSILPNLVANHRFDIYGLDVPDQDHIAKQLSAIQSHFLDRFLPPQS
jgi:NAD(P)H dehydrogenase (quinone)